MSFDGEGRGEWAMLSLLREGQYLPASTNPFICFSAAVAASGVAYSMKANPFDLCVVGSCHRAGEPRPGGGEGAAAGD